MLEIKNLHVSVNGTKILKGVNLEVKQGEVIALMGPNGSGKSTLSLVIMGHPNYKIDKGEILFNGKDITELEPDERARLGLFLSFQYPYEISGVTMSNFIRTAMNTKRDEKVNVFEFKKMLYEKLSLLKMPKEFAERYLNEGFSGGEKKRAEILQLAMLQPKIAILDESDSGTDVDALKTIADGINNVKKNNGTGFLVITHYNRILKYLKPDKVVVLVGGRTVDKKGAELADEIDVKGYSKYTL